MGGSRGSLFAPVTGGTASPLCVFTARVAALPTPVCAVGTRCSNSLSELIDAGPHRAAANDALTRARTCSIRFLPFVLHFRYMFRHRGVMHYSARFSQTVHKAASDIVRFSSTQPFTRLYKQYRSTISPSVHTPRLITVKHPSKSCSPDINHHNIVT